MNAADTTTTLSSLSNTSVFGQSVTFSVSVSGTTATPTGSVVFYDGSTALDTETLDGSGDAAFTTSALAVDSHTITAVYGGDSNYNSSTSSAVDQAVDFATSTTMASSEPNPSVFGQSVTFTAGVSAVSPGSGTPTGSIVFYDGSTAVDTETLDGSGDASFTTSALSVGTHDFTVCLRRRRQLLYQHVQRL